VYKVTLNWDPIFVLEIQQYLSKDGSELSAHKAVSSNSPSGFGERIK
jgi:hypothetical protein